MKVPSLGGGSSDSPGCSQNESGIAGGNDKPLIRNTHPF